MCKASVLYFLNAYRQYLIDYETTDVYFKYDFMSYEDDFLATGKHIHGEMKENIERSEMEILQGNFENVRDIVTYTYNGLYMRDKDPRVSFEYTSMCAAQGNESCEVRLAYLLTLDEGYKDYARAFKLIKTLVGRNNPAATSLLGYYYYKGIEVERSVKKALFCFKRILKRRS